MYKDGGDCRTVTHNTTTPNKQTQSSPTFCDKVSVSVSVSLTFIFRVCHCFNMDSTLGNNSYNHHQVVIIVDYDDGRLFPLTEEIPKCLLPVANRKILGYQLDMLQSCGATGICLLELL